MSVPSHAKLVSLTAIQGRRNTFSRSTKSKQAKKTDDFWFAASGNAIWSGNRVWIHPFERKLSSLSNGVFGKVVQCTDRELFDLKARGDFLITLYYLTNKLTQTFVLFMHTRPLYIQLCRSDRGRDEWHNGGLLRTVRACAESQLSDWSISWDWPIRELESY